MKILCAVLGMSMLLAGCVAVQRQAVKQGIAPGTDILSCMQESASLRSREFNEYFQEAESVLDNDRDEDVLRFICLSLHTKASYQQFKEGEKALRDYIKLHPDNSKELQGLLGLVGRLDQAKISRWSHRKKLLDEKEELEAEVASLQARVDTLLREHEQDMVRIQELRNQIEQLKNIENIIKNREHGS